MFCESCGRIIYCVPPPVESDENGPGATESQAVESNP